MIIFQIFVIYIAVVFVIIPLLVPYLGYGRSPVPEKLPEQLQKKVHELAALKTQTEFLAAAYNLVTQKYYGGRVRTLVNFWRAWIDPFGDNAGFAPCNVSNYLLRSVLIASGKFTEKDIKVRHTFLNFFIHQYLRVKVGDEWVDIDPWGKALGAEFGRHASLFF